MSISPQKFFVRHLCLVLVTGLTFHGVNSHNRSFGQVNNSGQFNSTNSGSFSGTQNGGTQTGGSQNGGIRNGGIRNGGTQFQNQGKSGIGTSGNGNTRIGNGGTGNGGVANGQDNRNQAINRNQPNGAQSNNIQTNNRQGTGGGVQSTQGLGGQIPLPSVRKNPNQPLPRPFPELSAKHIEYLNQLLMYWETNSNKIKRYHCKFTNWTYNSMQVPIQDPQSKHVFAQTISVGTVKFAAPDKGLFDSEKVWAFDKGQFSKKQDPFKESKELRQKWLCNGKAIYEFLYARKELTETPIPEEMQGERIVDGPLPFLFGAKSADLKARYWIRVITPPDRSEKGEYWLEAYPKYRRDAANFQKVEIVLERKDFLPAVLTMYAPDHDFEKGRVIAKQTIKFDKRKIWETEQLNGVQRFFDELSKAPSTPFGWRRVNTKLRDTEQNRAISQKNGIQNRK